MSNETSKSNRLRNKEFFDKYLKGRVIDIGCGTDPVTLSAEPYDLIYGDPHAGKILESRSPQSYDCVYSSHCLEHMEDVPAALAQWWALVRPGGYLILVVPDEDLYEQGFWPSIFNADHKATFRLDKEKSWSPVSYDIRKLVCLLSGAKIESVLRQDDGYDYSLSFKPTERPRQQKQWNWLSEFQKSISRHLKIEKSPVYIRLYRWLGNPVDQTMGSAMAQIQIVVRKVG